MSLPSVSPATPIIPTLGSFNKPLPHTNLKTVKRLLLGLPLDVFKDEDGRLTTFYEMIEETLIPEASNRIARFCRTNFDYTRETWFFNGTYSHELVLPRRFIVAVNLVMLRYLPSAIWYRFVRPRFLDGSEFTAIGGIEPALPGPEELPPAPTGVTYEQTVQDIIYTGIEDADLFVDRRRRTITIPPRVLYASVQTPEWNYTFFNATMNVETHFTYGFPPIAYTDGRPLIFDPVTGVMSLTSPPTESCPGGAPVDWSSGMPKAIQQACARIVLADILRRLWRGISGGLSSISVDGASESYGNSPFGGEAEREEARAFEQLKPFAILML